MTMTQEVFIEASASQKSFIANLLSEREVDGEFRVCLNMRVETGELSKSDATKEIGFLLKAPKSTAPAKKMHVVPGYYWDPKAEKMYEVVTAKKTGNVYAKKMVPPAHGKKKGSWIYAPGAIQHAGHWTLVTKVEAAALGKKWSMCMICGATLTDDTTKGPDGLTSLQRGIGPVCAKKF